MAISLTDNDNCLPLPNVSKAAEQPIQKSDPMYKKASYAYYNARARCLKQHHKDYPSYGGKGIKFLYKSFAEMVADIGLPDDKALSLDRIDPNSHYQIGNCRWANKHAQDSNKKASLGGAVPTLAQVVAMHTIEAAKPQARVMNTVAWKRWIAAIAQGGFSAEDVEFLREAGLWVNHAVGNWELGQVPDLAEQPGHFYLPSLTYPERFIRLVGGPFHPHAKDGMGLLRGLGTLELAANLPSRVVKWVNEDLNSKTKSGALWVGQATTALLAKGGVEGWMFTLACRARKTEMLTVQFTPVLSLLKRLEELGAPYKWNESGAPVVTAKLLLVPDLQLDLGPGFNLTPLQNRRIGDLLELRRKLGLKTMVGIQNHNKLHPAVAHEVFGHLMARELSDLSFNELAPGVYSKPTGPLQPIKKGFLNFSGLAAALKDKVPI